jgi:undecaprenyl-diphosphatase
MTNRARHAVAITALGAVAAFATLTVLVARHVGVVDRADHEIHAWLIGYGRAHPDWLTAWMVITHFGDTLTLSCIDLALCGLCVLQHRWRVAALVAVLAIGGWAVRIGVRDLVARPRPTDGFWPESGYSFPSGHTSNAAITVCLALIVAWPYLRRRGHRLAMAGAVMWAAAVGFSRLAGGVHWPSDVLGGLLLAVGLTSATATVVSLLTRPPAGAAPDMRSRMPGH